nr:hypothetical protein [Tanacetum cinerariifolium]
MLKKHYKELFDSIKITRDETIKHTTSLIAQNAEFKAHLQKKGFAIAALKNELRKLTGNSMNTKFAKSSILGKPVLQPHRNQSVVRQPIAFKFARPRILEQRFASQVDVNTDFSKPITTHYFHKEREYAILKTHHVIASSKSRNSSKNMPRFSLNDMVHNHYLDEARKKTQEKGTSINVQEEQNLDLSACTPFNLKKERIKTWTKDNVIYGRPRYKRRCCSVILAESDLLPHAHAQTTKIYYKHQDSRIKKGQELKTKTFANSDIKDNSSETNHQGRLLKSFQEDAKYEHEDMMDTCMEKFAKKKPCCLLCGPSRLGILGRILDVILSLVGLSNVLALVSTTRNHDAVDVAITGRPDDSKE